MSTKYDYSVHIEASIIEAEDQKLNRVVARRDVAAKRLADAMADHAKATVAHKLALSGEGSVDPFETQQRLNDAAARVSTAQQATSAVETAIQAAKEQHESDRGHAFGPVVTVALGHLSDAAKLADQARALEKQAREVWTAAAAAIQHATMSRAHLALNPKLFAQHDELVTVEGQFHIPSAEQMAERLKHCKVY